MAIATDRADVAIKPPFLFMGALMLGALLSLVIPLGPRLASPNGQALAVGAYLRGDRLRACRVLGA